MVEKNEKDVKKFFDCLLSFTKSGAKVTATHEYYGMEFDKKTQERKKVSKYEGWTKEIPLERIKKTIELCYAMDENSMYNLMTAPANWFVFEPEIKDDRAKQEELCERVTLFLKQQKFTFMKVHSGGNSIHFWILLYGDVENPERKRCTNWLSQQVKICPEEVDFSGASTLHLWAIPGVFRSYKGKCASLIEIHKGTEKMQIPPLPEGEKKKEKDKLDYEKELAMATGNNDRYFEKAKGNIIDTLSSASSDRNMALNKAAFALGTFVGAQRMSEADAISELKSQIPGSIEPSEMKKLEKTIESGLTAGKNNPNYTGLKATDTRVPKKTEKEWCEEVKNLLTPTNEEGKSTPPNMKLVRDCLTSWLLSKHHFILREMGEKKEHLFWYDDGVYNPNGAERIKEWINEKLEKINEGHHVSKAMVTEIVHRVGIKNYVSNNRINPPELVNFKNGVLKLKTKEFSPHTPDKYFTYKLTYNYDPEATCPLFMEFLETSARQNELKIIQEMAGYCLFPTMQFQKWFVIYGQGQNGKSVLLDTLIQVIGEENVATLPLQGITENRFLSARLQGKRANISSETGHEEIKTTRVIKVLSSGEGIPAEFKGVDSFDLKNNAKIILAANVLPEMAEYSDGNMRRVCIIHFTKQIDEEMRIEGLKYKIWENELPGIFNWMLEGLGNLTYRGKFLSHMSIEKTRDEWEKLSDPMKMFIEENVVEKARSKEDEEKNRPIPCITPQDAFDRYTIFSEDLKLPRMKQKRFSYLFGRALNECGYRVSKSKNAPYGWDGVAFCGVKVST